MNQLNPKTADPPSEDANSAWKTCDFHPTFSHGTDGEYVDVVVNILSNQTTTLVELMGLIKRFRANIKSGVGSRLTTVQTNSLHLTLPLENVAEFKRALSEEFQVGSDTTRTEETFQPVMKLFANFNMSVFIEEDRPGVLASLLLKLSKFDVRVVSMTAATGPSQMGGLWGRAEAKLRVPCELNPQTLWDVLEAEGNREGWKLRLDSREGAFSMSNYTLHPEDVF